MDPSHQQNPLGTHQVPLGTQQVPLGTQQVPLGTHQVPLGTQQVPLGTHQVPLGTQPQIVDVHQTKVVTQEIINPGVQPGMMTGAPLQTGAMHTGAGLGTGLGTGAGLGTGLGTGAGLGTDPNARHVIENVVGAGLQDPYTNYAQQTAMGVRAHNQPSMHPGHELGVKPTTCVDTHPTGAGALGAGALGAGALGAGALGAGAHGTHGTHGTGTGTGLGTGTGTGLATGKKNRMMVTFRPLEGRFTKDKDLVGKMDPYCKFKIGWHSGKSAVAKSGGTNPVWSDVITLKRKTGHQFAKLKVKDRDRLSLNDRLGEAKIDLDQVAAVGRTEQWYPLFKGKEQTGEVLVAIECVPQVL